MVTLKSNHRGVGGLISLVALIIVFGVASIAFLDINAIQSRFLEASVEVNNIQMNRNDEQLNFTASSGIPYTVEVTNMWSKQTVLDSYIAFDNTGTITVKRYFNETTMPNKQNIVPAGSTTSITFDTSNGTATDVKLLFITENGKQCIIPIPISWRVC